MKQIIAVTLLLAFLSSPALANWTGDTVTGILNFGGFGATNFFDPVNGYVPGGSSGIQPNAVVADPDGAFVEFMYLNGFAGINVDIDDTSLVVHQFPATPGYEGIANSWDIYISGFDPDIVGFVGVLSFPALSLSLLDGGDRLLIRYPGGNAFGPQSTPDGWRLVLTLQPIPAPGAILLGSIGAGLVGWLRRRRTL